MTNKYKVSKTAENVAWESVQKKYSEILDRYKDEQERPKAFAVFLSRPSSDKKYKVKATCVPTETGSRMFITFDEWS